MECSGIYEISAEDLNANRSVVMNICRKPIGPILLCLSLLPATSFAQTDGSVNLTATIHNLGGSGAEHNVVVWVTSSSGTFIKTLWKQGADTFSTDEDDGDWNHFSDWNTARSGSTAFDGYSSATTYSYAATNPSPPTSGRASNPINVTWDCMDSSNTALVADGDYKFYIQYAEDRSGSGPVTSALTWTKGPSPDTRNPADHGTRHTPEGGSNFTDISIVWTPVIPPEPEIAVEQPAGSDIPDGGSKAFGTVTVGSNSERTFTIRNTGTANLTGLTIMKNGANPGDFTVTSSPSSPVGSGGGSTTFIVQFAPSAAGARSAAIHIANNDSDENPFDINLTGTGVTPFDAWAAGLPAGQDRPDDTPQGDGVSNLLKFASNLDATVPDVRRLTVGAGDTAGLPGGATVGGVLRLEYLRRKASTNPGITYTPQFSGDLDMWTDFSGAESVNSIDTTWERVVIDDVPPPGATERYGRLKVVLNP